MKSAKEYFREAYCSENALLDMAAWGEIEEFHKMIEGYAEYCLDESNKANEEQKIKSTQCEIGNIIERPLSGFVIDLMPSELMPKGRAKLIIHPDDVPEAYR